MRFADRFHRTASGLACAASILACSDRFEPLSKVPAPATLDVSAVRLNTVRLRWARVDDEDVTGYAIERRENLSGPFSEVVAQVPQTGSAVTDVTWIDTSVQPDTYYGYRVFAVTRFGDRSPPTVVGGTKSPPLPGIEVRTASLVSTTSAVDPDGYELTITGPDSVRTSVGIAGTRRFSPLPLGTYQVAIGGLVAQCAVSGPSTRTVTVTDTVAQTITPVSFNIACKDATRGEITVTVSATGREIDEEVTLDLLGEAGDATLPESLRVVSLRRTSQTQGSVTTFTNLRPGTYDVTLEDLAPNCTLSGAATRTVHVTALGNVAIAYEAACTATGENGGGGAGPFYWRNVWAPDEGAPGSRVRLRPALDLTAVPAQKVQGVQADIIYDPAVLRLETSRAAQLPNLIVNGSMPGKISFIAAAASGIGGLVQLAEFEFTVVGASGDETTTITQNVKAGTPAFQSQISVEEGTFTVGAGGGTTNQPPTAKANGPYTATAGVAVTLSASNSFDPDGGIVAYHWDLGNGQTSSVGSPPATYAAAGTYTATLTVTDDQGATGTDQATITVSPPPDTPPLDTPSMIWRSSFGPVDVANDLVAITISYDMRSDLADTPGAEALERFVLDSLKWNPAVLQFYAVNLGPNITGTSNQAKVSAGNIALQGTIGAGFQQGLITIATIRFRIVGASGARTSTTTHLGVLQGTTSTNGYVYNAKTEVVEGTFTAP